MAYTLGCAEEKQYHYKSISIKTKEGLNLLSECLCIHYESTSMI